MIHNTPIFRAIGGFFSSSTRVVEYLLAWLMIAWGSTLIGPDKVMGPVHAYLVAIFREEVWGWFAICCGFIRLLGLTINGSHRRSPLLRLGGSMLGVLWWITIISLYSLPIFSGAVDEPLMYRTFFVFLFFEGVSVYRCGADAERYGAFGKSRKMEHLEEGLKGWPKPHQQL